MDSPLVSVWHLTRSSSQSLLLYPSSTAHPQHYQGTTFNLLTSYHHLLCMGARADDSARTLGPPNKTIFRWRGWHSHCGASLPSPTLNGRSRWGPGPTPPPLVASPDRNVLVDICFFILGKLVNHRVLSNGRVTRRTISNGRTSC